MQLIRPDQLEAAVGTLAEAFWDEPLMQIVAPNESKRAEVCPWFFFEGGCLWHALGSGLVQR